MHVLIKHRMAPQEWAVGEQRQRLDEFFPTYLEYGVTGNYQPCWPLLFIPWFETWPATPIPLPDLDHVDDVVPEPLAVSIVTLTAKQTAALKAKRKREVDWRNELIKVRGMGTVQRAAWCLGKGVSKKKQVCCLIHVTFGCRY